MDASSYKFSPSEVKVQRPGKLTIQIKNVSRSEHNFTLEDTGGKVLANVELPPGQTVSTNVELDGAGVYKFYCDKPMHSTMGMKGQIIIG